MADNNEAKELENSSTEEQEEGKTTETTTEVKAKSKTDETSEADKPKKAPAKKKPVDKKKTDAEVVKKKRKPKTEGDNEESSEDDDAEEIEKRLATEKNPTIEAIINGLFRFETREQALDRLNAIEKYFIVSAKLPKDKDDEDSLKLWIRGYKVDADEEKKGYLGNYAMFQIKELKDGKHTIAAEKQRIAIKYHPQRKRAKKKHPDWGHPCLRIVKKKIVFEGIEEAQKILNQLHEDFPEITIPAVNKLFLIIYSKATQPPVTKYVLEIKAAKEGGFYIDYQLNTYKKQKMPEKVEKELAEKNNAHKTPDGQEPLGKGYFASMVSLKRNKKDQIAELRKKNKEENKKIDEESKQEASETSED